jgi:putative mRNA 3-end processing factor
MARTRRIGGVTVSFHPAGHVPGSAQIRVERGGEVWVVSGDYKTEADGLAEPFAPVPCHTFISECTFGLPVFRWRRSRRSWPTSPAGGPPMRRGAAPRSLGAYGLWQGAAHDGRAARPWPDPDPWRGRGGDGVLRAQGYPCPHDPRDGGHHRQNPSRRAGHRPALGAWVGLGRALWPRHAEEAFASGWMALRGIRRRRGWGWGSPCRTTPTGPGLNAAIRATGAERVFVTHGYTAPFRRWLEEQGRI